MKFILSMVGVFASVIGGFLLAGGHVPALYQPAEMIIISGAAISAFALANPVHVIKDVYSKIPSLISGSPYHKERYIEMLGFMYAMFSKIRKDGIIALEQEIEDPLKSPIFAEFPTILENKRTTEFICDYFRLMVSGNMNAFEIENLIDVDLEGHQKSMHHPVEALSALADSLPAFGIVACVMGVVICMGAIGGDPDVLGEKIAAALVGTFLGILLSYGFFSPFASELNAQAEEEAMFYTCIKTCFIAYLNGYAPQIAVEFGRMASLPHIRPSFQELDECVRSRKLKK